MGLSSYYEAKETALAAPLLSALTKLTEFFSPEQIEASARRSGKPIDSSRTPIFIANYFRRRWSPRIT